MKCTVAQFLITEVEEPAQSRGLMLKNFNKVNLYQISNVSCQECIAQIYSQAKFES